MFERLYSTVVCAASLLLCMMGVLAGQAQDIRPETAGPPGLPQAPSQAVGTVLLERDVEEIAAFSGARRLRADPNQRLYVVDTKRSTVTILTVDGRTRMTLGGRGTEAGAFDEPIDVDPTNGLEIYVADSGNGRIQRFSKSGKYVEALPVGRVDPTSRTSARQPLFDAGRDGSDARAEGRPVAVAAAPNGDVFVLDAEENAVLRFDRQRRQQPFAGGFDAREGPLVEPVAMVVSERRVFVADRGTGDIIQYDRFGTPASRLNLSEPVTTLSLVGDALWAVSSKGVFVIDRREERVVGRIATDLNEPIVDATRVDRQLFLLTPTRLLLVREPEDSR